MVTGAGGGLGPACCSALAGLGMRLAIVDIDAGAAQVAAAGLPPGTASMVATVDVTSRADFEGAVRETIREMGGLHVLVNLAGVIRNSMLEKVDDEDFELVMATHVRGVLNGMRAASRHLKDQRYGRIVNMSSIAVRGSLAGSSYGAAKGAIEALTRSAAFEMARYGVTANCVAPGLIGAGMFTRVPPDYQEAAIARTPMRRAGTAEEVASCIAFLASQASSYVTGQTLFVCGGLSIGY